MTTLPPVAQTAPQLYCQLVPLGLAPADLARIRDACLIGARVTSDLLRGSGKPFACHLIGVASLVAESLPGDVDALLASLLHAMYQARVPYGVDRAARCARLRAEAGEIVESLVARYDAAGPLDGRAAPWAFEDPVGRVVRIMQLADELEDALDGGPWWHGKPDDSDAVMGGATHRVGRFRVLERCYAEAETLGAPLLYKRWQSITQTWQAGRWPVELRSGHHSSFSIDAR